MKHENTPTAAHAASGTQSAEDSIAIIGIGCRYPDASNPAELWTNLLAAKDSIGPYPGGRFPNLDAFYEQVRRKPGRILTDQGGFLANIAGFDSQFFEISPRESIYIDPQHRLLLEVAWEALEDAGQVREAYEKSTTGVYTGLWTNEYESRLYESATARDFYSITGCGRFSASGRLSFTFGFQGPSVTVDTACSSSLVAVHMACQALWAGEIDMALAGGANLLLGPEITELFTTAKMLSPDGRCKFGDISANGFVRSEGAAMVVLKRLSQAVADKDPIYAVIRGGAVNNDGRSGGLLVTPSRDGQREMLSSAWKSAGIAPEDLRYIEMHGTGTAVGDPIEIAAVGTALADAGVIRSCAVGSIKTNFGHTESAAGVAGLIKAALALKHRTIPPSLHFHTGNPNVPWDRIPVHVAANPVDLSEESGPILMGVSSFGITGTNAHIILAEMQPASGHVPRQSSSYLLPVSARSIESLQGLLERHLEQLRSIGSDYPILDVCYTAGARRNHHEFRTAIAGESLSALEENLRAAIAGEECEGVVSGRTGAAKKKIVFVTPGQGSQWLGMARELFDQEPVFREAFERCDSAIAAETGWRLSERVLGPEAEQYSSHIDVIQPALFTMSVALAAVWHSWGVEPDAIVGHSMGEVAAAHIAGILNLPDAVAIICRRSRLMKTISSAGGMATVELPLQEVERLLQGWPEISIGASNGPNTTVISGDSKAVEALLRELEAKEIYCRQIKVDVASHSAQVDPILGKLLASLAEIRPMPAQIPMLSTVTGEYAPTDGQPATSTVMDAAYWVENLRRSVLFAPAIQKLSHQGHDTFVELSPHPILLPSIEACARAIHPRAVAIASLRREKPARGTMLRGVGALYVSGCKIDWKRMYPEDACCVSLPQYPFQRERCWPEPSDPSLSRVARHSGETNPLLGWKFESSLQPNTLLWETDLQIASVPYLNDHRLLHSAVFPASGHLDMALSAAKSLFPEDRFEVRNAVFASAAYIPEQGVKTFQLALTPEGNGTFMFEVHSRGDDGEAGWPLRSRGIVQRVETNSKAPVGLSLSDLQQQYTIHRDSRDHYERTTKSGLQYGPAFQLVEEVWVGEGESLCRLRNDAAERGSSVIHPTLLDACFQAMAHVWPERDGFHAEDTYLPVAIDQVHPYRAVPEGADLFTHAKLVSADPLQGAFRVDIQLLDSEGEVLLDICGMEVKRATQRSPAASSESLYFLEWIEEKTEEKAEATVALLSKASAENWIVFADRSGVAEAIKASLGYIGGRCTLVKPGPAFRRVAPTEFEVNPESREDMELLIREATQDSSIPTAIVHLWSLENHSSSPYTAEVLTKAQTLGSQSVPGIVQAIASQNWQNPPRLWLVTAGAVAIGKDVDPPRIESAPMWGLGLAIACEHAELRVASVDIGIPTDAEAARALARQILLGGKEDRIALRGNAKYIARLARLSTTSPEATARSLAEGEDYRIEITSAGVLDNIELRAYPRSLPKAGEIAVAAIEAGLNFNDVLKAMGLYPGLIPGKPIPLGNECVGKVIAVGEGVTGFHIGDEVIVLTPSMVTTGLMASSVTVPVELAIHKPARLTMEQAATVAIAYVTAYWSLIEQARIRRGEWILIHAGAGGVGLAAIEIARWAGANIIATVGSKEKENHLRSLGIEHVLNSRSLSFAEGVMEITAGRGVDVVLNSLAGEFLSKSLQVLAPYGRFIEMGKRDVYEDKRIGLKILRNNISFHVVDIAAAVEDRRAYVAELLREVMRHIEVGEWQPLPVTSFSSDDPAAPFRFMAQARHIGKISIRMERAVHVLPAKHTSLFSTDATYLITGGLGGIALLVAEWMAKNGAGHLVLLSRRAPSQESLEAISRIEAHGTTVGAIRADIAREDDLANVLKTIHESGSPLRGVIHAAAVVDDALVVDLSPERFPPVMAPKISGTWNLHRATIQEDLDFFVMFSSIAAIHPQPGMGSYAAANAFLDSFAHYRRALGKLAISINWGAWDQVGLARSASTDRSIESYQHQGMRKYSGQQALDALECALQAKAARAIAVRFDWTRVADFYGLDGVPPIYSSFVSKTREGADGSANRSEILELLTAADSPQHRLEILENYLQEVLGRVLKLATKKIDRERALGSMGLDSLMGLEFVRRLSNALQIAVPATVVFNYPTIQLLAAHLLRRLQLEPLESVMPDAKRTDATAATEKDEAVSDLSGDMSEEDALAALIGNSEGSF